MKNESIYRMAVVILLTGILTIQLAILLKMPHTKAGAVDVNVQNGVEVHSAPFHF